MQEPDPAGGNSVQIPGERLAAQLNCLLTVWTVYGGYQIIQGGENSSSLWRAARRIPPNYSKNKCTGFSAMKRQCILEQKITASRLNLTVTNEESSLLVVKDDLMKTLAPVQWKWEVPCCGLSENGQTLVKLIMLLCKTPVWPDLEHCIEFWPQKGPPKMIKTLELLFNEEWLQLFRSFNFKKF